MKKYVCELCGYEYDSRVGDSSAGIEAGTEFEDLPDTWVCPMCGAGRDDFAIIGTNEEDDDQADAEVGADVSMLIHREQE